MNARSLIGWCSARTIGRIRSALLLGLFAVGLAMSLCLAFGLRYDFVLPEPKTKQLLLALVWFVPVQILSLIAFRVVRILPGYFSVPGLIRVIYAQGASAVVLWAFSWGIPHLGGAVARTIIAADFLFACFFLSSICLALRLYREHLEFGCVQKRAQGRRVGIVGAGEAGTRLALELSLRPGLGLEPVAFFDDDPLKWRGSIHNVPIAGPPEALLNGVAAKFQLDEVIIAMPSVPVSRLAHLVRILNRAKLKYRTVPSLEQITAGQVSAANLRPVEIEDLLSRPSGNVDAAVRKRLIAGRVVMVTGAGGSFGSELARQLAVCAPSQLLLVERSEPALFAIEQELLAKGYGSMIIPLVADIGDSPRMHALLSRQAPAWLFHAAAHTLAPLMERQPGEAVRNNSIGTARLADLALQHHVERFVLISTDTAIHPASVVGASKRLAEMYLQALAADNPGRTKFMAVRLGNLLGSSGSMVSNFKRQIAAGGPVTVANPEMKSGFMTISEAAGLVIESAPLGEGGEIFVLDTGDAVKMVDLARQLIRLSGLRPDVDVAIKFVGLRPGEKSLDELAYPAKDYPATTHAKIKRVTTVAPVLPRVRTALASLECETLLDSPEQLRGVLRHLVPEYAPAAAFPRAEIAYRPLVAA